MNNEQLEQYYSSDHQGHAHLAEIYDYSKAHQQLTVAERKFCVDYYNAGQEHIVNRTLHTLRNKPWMKLMNFRYGWKSIYGTLGEVFVAVCQNNNVENTKFRIPINQTEEEQVLGQDLIAVNPQWKQSYNVQVKQLHFGSYGQLKIDETELCVYDREYVHRLVLVDVKQLMLYHFDYGEFLDHYTKHRIVGGWLDIELLKEMEHFVSLTL